MLKNAKRTKIVCTLGPASEKEEVLTALIENGLNVTRMNFSHGSHEEHKGRMDLVKKIREKLNKPVAILLDTKGPEIRTGNFDQPEVLLEEGQKFTITMNDVIGNKEIWKRKSRYQYWVRGIAARMRTEKLWRLCPTSIKS